MCKFIWAATQVPLGAKYNEVIPEHKRFTPQMLIGKLRAEGKEVRLWRCLRIHYVISLNLRTCLLCPSWRLRHRALAVWRLLLAGGPGHRPDKVLAVLQRGGVARGAAPQGTELLLTCLTVLHSGDDTGGQPSTQRSHAEYTVHKHESTHGPTPNAQRMQDGLCTLPCFKLSQALCRPDYVLLLPRRRCRCRGVGRCRRRSW